MIICIYILIILLPRPFRDLTWGHEDDRLILFVIYSLISRTCPDICGRISIFFVAAKKAINIRFFFTFVSV